MLRALIIIYVQHILQAINRRKFIIRMELSHSTTSMRSQDLCICHSLHADCNPNTCDEAAKPSDASAKRLLPKEAPLTLRDFQEAAARGCPCCSLLVKGLCLPEIKSVWNHGSVKEEDAEIELLDRRVNIQVTDHERARYASLWHHFGFFSLPGLVTEPVSCSAFPVGTSLSDSTDSETSWRNLRAWLIECESHEACKRIAFNPKRIIDVGASEEAVLIPYPSCRAFVANTQTAASYTSSLRRGPSRRKIRRIELLLGPEFLYQYHDLDFVAAERRNSVGRTP
jgi:hypothetical protein